MDMMSYLMGRNSGGAKKGAKIEVVTELPETGEANVIYLVPKQDTGDNDIFDEYIWVNNDWELIGSTAIDLSNYYTKSETQQLINASMYNGQEIVTVEQFVGTSSNIDFSNDNLTKINSILNKSSVRTEEYVKFIISMTPNSQNSGATAQQNDFLILVNIKKSNPNQSFTISCIAVKVDKYDSKLFYTTATIYFTTDSDGLVSSITGVRINNGNSKEITTKDYVDNKSIQYTTMPTASVNYLGKIVQYTGTTNANYTNGYFYIGTTDGESPATYGWSNVNVQDLGDYLEVTKLTPATILDSVMLCKLSSGIYDIQGYCRVNENYSSTSRDVFVIVTAPNSTSYTYIWVYDKVAPRMEYHYVTRLGHASNQDVHSSVDLTKLPIKTDVLTLSGLLPYSNNKTYQIGNYVYKSDTDLTIYKCNTANTSGTWNSSKWTQKTYMEYLSDTLVGGALNGSY